MQQNITAEQSQVMASFSDKGKSLGSSSVEVLACSRQGDSLINNAAGIAIARQNHELNVNVGITIDGFRRN